MFDMQVLIDIENHPEYIEKMMLESDVRPDCVEEKKTTKRERLNGRQRTQKHKLNVRRRFISLNPTLDINDVEGIRVYNSIFTSRPTEYSINHVEKIFKSKNGVLKVYHGDILWDRGAVLLKRKDHHRQATVNKKIRQTPVSEESSENYYVFKRKFSVPEYVW